MSLADLGTLAADRAAVEQVIQRLADARLVLIEAGGERDGTTVELCHESLIDSWDKFQQWLSESEQDAQLVARLDADARAAPRSRATRCGARLGRAREPCAPERARARGASLGP